MITATISGTLGRDAELTHVGDRNTPRLSFSVASNERSRAGEKETVWIACSLFGVRGASLAAYLTKGTRIVAIGKLRCYKGKQGDPRLALDVSEIDLLGGGTKREDNAPKRERATDTFGGADDFDDGIPF